MTCIDPSVATDLGNLLGPSPQAKLQHIAGCSRCMAALAETAAVADLLRTDAPPRPGFAEAVGRALVEDRFAAESSPGPERGWGGWVAGWLMAGLTAVMAAGAASSAAPVAPGPSTLVIAAVWASAAFVLTARTSLREPDLSRS